MILKIRKYPHPMLRKKAHPVAKISKEIFELVDNMIETMLKEDGVALAANQVGSLLRIFVMNTAPHEETPKPVVFINPEILDKGETVIEEEGCLSFPELYLKIPRADNIRIHAKNRFNEDLVYETKGLLARAIQHEIDHLDGVLFIDIADETEIEKEKVQKYLGNLNSCVKT